MKSSGDPINKPLVQARRQAPPDQTPVPAPLAASSNGAFFPADPATAGPPGLSATPTVGALAVALKRRWFVAFGLASLAAGLVVAAAALLNPPKYVAETMLKLDSRPAQPIFNFRAGDPETDPAIFRTTQISIIKSSNVLNNALKSEKLKGLPISFQSVQALQQALKADFSQGPEVMTLRLSGDDPTHLADLLNAVVEAYKKEVEGNDLARRSITIAELEKNKQQYDHKLDQKRRELSGEMDHAGPDQKGIEERRHRAEHKVDDASDQLRRVRAELGLKKLDLAMLKERLQNIDREPVTSRDFRKALAEARAANHRLLGNLKPYLDAQDQIDAEIATWKRQLETDQSKKKLAALQQQRVTNQTNIEIEENKIRGDLDKEIRADRQEKLETDIAAMETMIQRLSTSERGLRTEYETCLAEWDAVKNANPQMSVTVQKLRDEETQILKVLEQLAIAPALLKAEPLANSRIAVVEPAETPAGKDYSRLIKYGGAGGFGAFGVVLFGIAFLEFRARKVGTVEDVTQGLGMPLLGTVPLVPARSRSAAPANGSAGNAHWQGVLSEAVDAIRTRLLHDARTSGVHVVMVTSGGSGEGKTSLASQLAASLARAWRKTLLLDGDLRNPAAHKLFSLPLEPGFSEVLRGEVTVADAVKPTPLSRLWLMPAGHWDAHAVQALAQDGVNAIFDQFKEQYDFIIVDSCPVLPVADALLLGQHADGVVYSVLRDVSRLPSIYAAQQKLQALDVRSLGAVVIGATGDRGSRAYNYGAAGGV
jgi:succinoglycan biosynthesis transport protein ExoP